jgi:aryl-alcohol dehydrogenase-like predicted oxidoreductase
MMKEFASMDERKGRIADAVKVVAQEVGRSPAQVALAWLLRRPYRVPVIPIVGARKLSQVQDNLASIDLHLSGDHLRRLDEVSGIELGFPHDFFTKDMVRGFAYGGMGDRIDARPRS